MMYNGKNLTYDCQNEGLQQFIQGSCLGHGGELLTLNLGCEL